MNRAGVVLTFLLAALTAPARADAQDIPPEPVEAPSALPAAPTPEQHAPLADQCTQAVDLVPGRPIPAGLVDARGIVLCRGTVLPTSDLAYLLDRDTWVTQAVPRLNLLDLQVQRAQLVADFERGRADRFQRELDKPTPFFRRPGVQQAVGAIEAVALTVVVGAIWVNVPNLQAP